MCGISIPEFSNNVPDFLFELHVRDFSREKNCEIVCAFADFSSTLFAEKYRDRGEGAWFFLSPPARMYKGSRRTRRTGDGCGWWKSSHSVRFGVIGDITFSKNSFKYFSGTLKNGQKTKWIMREFTVPEYMVKRGSNSATVSFFGLCGSLAYSPRCLS